jgi:hypothetical protein
VHPARQFSRIKKLYLPNSALRTDLLVSMAKMKTHHWVGATLSMKNLFGVVPGGIYGWPKNVLHWAGIEESIADLHAAFPRQFAIVDGIVGMEGNGPIQGSPKHAGVLVAGKDPGGSKLEKAKEAALMVVDRLQPDGRLFDYQRHKLRVFGIYNPKFGRFGSASLGPVWRVNSGTVFSYIAQAYPITAIELARNPGYPDKVGKPWAALQNPFGVPPGERIGSVRRVRPRVVWSSSRIETVMPIRRYRTMSQKTTRLRSVIAMARSKDTSRRSPVRYWERRMAASRLRPSRR